MRRRAGITVVLCAWMFSILACSQDFSRSFRPAPTDTPQAVALLPDSNTQAAVVEKVIEPTHKPTLTFTATSQPTATVTLTPSPSPTPIQRATQDPPILYYTQAGDTLKALAARFAVQPEEITSPQPIPQEGLFNPGVLLLIPPRLGETSSATLLVPDSEVVYSPSALDFNIADFVKQSGGYLSTYREWRSTGWFDGAGIIQRVATENSINPRLLLALLEFHSHWVYDRPATQDQTDYPLGRIQPSVKGLYNQLIWAVNQLSIGYYAYREGRLTDIRFSDGLSARLAPDLNAGTAALQYYFAQLYDSRRWLEALDSQTGFPALHAQMFGDPWQRARTVEPLYPAGVAQPPLSLPFARGWTWSYTGGPHGAWEHDGAYAALDFAPGANESGCVESPAWVVAAAAGLVVRTGVGLVVLDLDGDGYEQTGWVLVYLHVAAKDRIPLGSWVAANDPLGHASCEGWILDRHASAHRPQVQRRMGARRWPAALRPGRLDRPQRRHCL